MLCANLFFRGPDLVTLDPEASSATNLLLDDVILNMREPVLARLLSGGLSQKLAFLKVASWLTRFDSDS